MSVPQIISDQQAYATSWVTQANAFINQVASLAGTEFSVSVPVLGYGRTGITDSAKSELAGQRPTRPTIPAITATAPVAPEFDFTPILPVEVATFSGTAPVLSLPTPPSSVLPSAPAQPTVVDPAIPSAPDVVIPVSPTVTLPTLPTPPSVVLPYFDATLPVDDLVIPSNTFSFFEQLYSSALLDAVRSKLLSDIENGGYGIETADEEALWERLRAREQEIAQQAIDEVLNFQSARGMPLPPGDLHVALDRAHQVRADKVSAGSRDISIKRADLFVQARQFALQQAKELENILIGYHSAVMERALNASKATLEAALKIYDATVARYNARLQAYQVEASVFESKIRAALAQVEIYKTQIEAARVEVDVQRVAVEAYNAQLAGIRAVVDIYRTRMEAAQIQANVERLRIDAFRGLVDAYAQQVQAKVAEFSMYKAQIEGETAKVTAFRAQVEGYTAQVQGAKVKAEVQVENLRAEVEQARTRLAGYQAQVDQFKAELLVQTETVRSNVELYRADTSAFATAIDALKSAYMLEIEELNSNTQWNIKAADVNVASAQVQLDALSKAAAIRSQSAQFGANFYASAMQAVLSSITTLAAEVQQS